MATKTEVHLIDDLDGESLASETVSFGLGSTSYEIDLSEQNAEKLRELFARYVDAGRKVGKGTGRSTTRSRTESFAPGGSVSRCSSAPNPDLS